MRAALLLLLVAPAAVLTACPPKFPDPPKQCDPLGTLSGGAGCLSDEICVDFICVPRPKCELDEDCDNPAFRCVLPAQICELREGFGDECELPDAPCAIGEFCSLGLCRPIDPFGSCTNRLDCDVGEGCDKFANQCIPEGPCTLAQDFPELGCDPGTGGGPGETCDVFSQRCILPCQEQCESAVDCPGSFPICNGSCQCVQCVTTEDCGPGLECDRDGRCISEDACTSDDECESPLICGPTLLCEVPPPACFSDFDCPIAEVCDIGSSRCTAPDGPCITDFLEPSNTPASAEPTFENNPNLQEIGNGELGFGLTLCPDDDDVFAVTLAAADLLRVTVTRAEPSAAVTLWLLDSDGEQSLEFSRTPPLGSGVIEYTAQVDETVFVRVNALGGNTEYDIRFERLSGAPCAADFFEPNDSFGASTSPPEGVTLTGSVCPGDEDFFRMPFAAGEAVRATLAFDSTVSDLDVAIFDAFGVFVVESAGISSPEVARKRFFNAGEAFVRVRGFGTDTGDYQLTIDVEPAFVCTEDASEPDNDVASARVLALGEEIAPEPRTMCLDDRDFFVVPLEDFERLVVQTQYDDSDVELAVDVMDALGENVLETSPAATGGAAVVYDAQGDETVVVRISGLGGGIGAYTLSIEKENQLDCAPDIAEPNNTVDTSSALAPAGTLLSICESDQDFFAIEGAAGRKLVVDASFRQADGDIDLMLLGLDGAQILAVADGTADGEHLEVLLPLDGTYTLRVFSLTSGARSRYSLNAVLASP